MRSRPPPVASLHLAAKDNVFLNIRNTMNALGIIPWWMQRLIASWEPQSINVDRRRRLLCDARRTSSRTCAGTSRDRAICRRGDNAKGYNRLGARSDDALRVHTVTDTTPPLPGLTYGPRACAVADRRTGATAWARQSVQIGGHRGRSSGEKTCCVRENDRVVERPRHRQGIRA